MAIRSAAVLVSLEMVVAKPLENVGLLHRHPRSLQSPIMFQPASQG